MKIELAVMKARSISYSDGGHERDSVVVIVCSVVFTNILSSSVGERLANIASGKCHEGQDSCCCHNTHV